MFNVGPLSGLLQPGQASLVQSPSQRIAYGAPGEKVDAIFDTIRVSVTITVATRRTDLNQETSPLSLVGNWPVAADLARAASHAVFPARDLPRVLRARGASGLAGSVVDGMGSSAPYLDVLNKRCASSSQEFRLLVLETKRWSKQAGTHQQLPRHL